jgi:hypothetical protein
MGVGRRQTSVDEGRRSTKPTFVKTGTISFTSVNGCNLAPDASPT